MPDTDVIAMLPRIKAGKFKTRIIVLTASEHTGEHALAVKYGASGIVTKQEACQLLTKEHSHSPRRSTSARFPAAVSISRRAASGQGER